MARFEVRKVDHSQSDVPAVCELVEANPEFRVSYRVYDTVTGRLVPFGSYRSEIRAEARAQREEERTRTWTTPR